jgi:hypothetical protein
MHAAVEMRFWKMGFPGPPQRTWEKEDRKRRRLRGTDEK